MPGIGYVVIAMLAERMINGSIDEFDENSEPLLRPAAPPAKGVAESSHGEPTLLQAQQQLLRRTEELARSEAQLRSALKAGRLVHWETDLASGVRHWTPEAMALFGLDLPDGRGRFGGDTDEFFPGGPSGRSAHHALIL